MYVVFLFTCDQINTGKKSIESYTHATNKKKDNGKTKNRRVGLVAYTLYRIR